MAVVAGGSMAFSIHLEGPPVVNAIVGLGLHFSNSLRMFTEERVSRAPPATRQRNDREADFRCGANPQQGEPS